MFWDGKIPSKMTNGGVPKFLHTLVNRPRQLLTVITLSSELPIRSFLDSTESSLNIEFNKINFSSKM